MKLLSLSTAEQGCSLCVTDGTSVVCEEYWDSKTTHSKRILTMIDHLIEARAGIVLDSLDGFVAARGPGSFTGLRIGISVIRGFCDAFAKPAYGVSSLDGIAFQFCFASVPVMAMMDARRGEVYYAIYQFEKGRLVTKTTEQVASPDQLFDTRPCPVLCVGSGAVAYHQLIKEKCPGALFDMAGTGFVRASTLVSVLHSSELPLDTTEYPLIPSYIRKSDAELQFVEK